MRITSKGQVTIPQAIREQSGLLPHTEVEIVIEDGKVVIRPEAKPAGDFAAALAEVRTARLAAEFDGWSSEQIMAFLRD